MTIKLIDDGTPDTVLECSECGKEIRYNYVNSRHNEARLDPGNLYDKWVIQIIEDETQEHECEVTS